MKPAICHPESKYYAKGLCRLCYMREFKAKHPEMKEAAKSYSAQYRKDNPEKYSQYYKARRADPEKRARDSRTSANAAYLQKYGMTIEQVEAYIVEQGSKCGICELALERSTAQIDHCHSTGYVRGVLCVACNTGIGQLGDNAEGVRKALNYLEKEPSNFKA